MSNFFSAELRMIADKVSSGAPGAENHWFVTLNRPHGPIKGVLVRPAAGTTGTFVGFDDKLFKV